MPHPFASHPRLDLFMGSLSPHKKETVGCTICHDGQGSATAFKWASHSPNDPFQEAEWRRDYGWFDNHHWIYPMTPNRHNESLCLKCHHDVSELKPSERFPDPPAPKLVKGFELIQDLGCYGCHEINGFDGPNKRIGPDLRTEPAYSAAALGLLAEGGLDDQQKIWAEDLVHQPRRQGSSPLVERVDLVRRKNAGRRSRTNQEVGQVAGRMDTPGQLRRVGPSLRYVASKDDFDFLYSWVRKPSDFRPTTKMPQFFGLAIASGRLGTRRIQEIRADRDSRGRRILVGEQPAV